MLLTFDQIFEIVCFGLMAVCGVAFFYCAYISKPGRLYMHHCGVCNPAKCDCDEYLGTMKSESVIASRYAVVWLIAFAIAYWL